MVRGQRSRRASTREPRRGQRGSLSSPFVQARPQASLPQRTRTLTRTRSGGVGMLALPPSRAQAPEAGCPFPGEEAEAQRRGATPPGATGLGTDWGLLALATTCQTDHRGAHFLHPWRGRRGLPHSWETLSQGREAQSSPPVTGTRGHGDMGMG